jgi:hypothetical protein
MRPRDSLGHLHDLIHECVKPANTCLERGRSSAGDKLGDKLGVSVQTFAHCALNPASSGVNWGSVFKRLHIAL